MAPEVIMCDPDNPQSANCAYTDKSDIWSIGITCIEIAEKNPPLSDIHPMQALTMIPKSEIGLAKPKNFSKPFVDFVTHLIVKNPDKRPSATEALSHPFMVTASQLDRQKILTEIVTTALKIKEKKKQGLEITEEDEDDVGRPAKTTLTLKQAKNSIVQIAQNASLSSGSTPTPSEPEPAPSISDFPTIVNNVQEGVVPVFEPVILTTLNEALTADVLDGQYILIGTERGLSFLDLLKPTMKIPQPLIQDIRYRQIQILPEYNVLIALSGKHDHIRQYNLASIRKLILAAEGQDPTQLALSNTTVPIQKVQIGQKEKSEYDYLNHQETDSYILVKRWTDDFIKIVNTRDTRSFSIEQTESTAYLCMLGQGITLFRWAVEPYNRFMKIKSFWVPESPKFVSIAQDGLNAVDLFVGYSSEMNRVSVYDSKVSEIRVHREMKTKNSGKARWQNLLQIPYSDAKLEQLLRENTKASATTNRKLAAVAGPTLKRGPTMTDRYYLGTYHRLTIVVDEKGHPMIGAGVGGWKDGVMWSEAPVLQILRPLQHVISVGKNNIEIVDWKSAVLKQRLTIDENSSFRFLCLKHGSTLLVVDKKRKGSMLYWMREASPPPRQAGSILGNIMKENAPVNLLEQANEDLEQLHLDEKEASVSPPKEKGSQSPHRNGLAPPSSDHLRPAQGPPPDEAPQKALSPPAKAISPAPSPNRPTYSQAPTPSANYAPSQPIHQHSMHGQLPPPQRTGPPAFVDGSRPAGPPRSEQYRQAVPQEYSGRPRPPPSEYAQRPPPVRPGVEPYLQRQPTVGSPSYYQRPPVDAYGRPVPSPYRPPPQQGYVDPRYQQAPPRVVSPTPRPMGGPPRPVIPDPRYNDPRMNPDVRYGDPRMAPSRGVPGVDPRIRPQDPRNGSYDPYGTLSSLYSAYTVNASTVARSDAGTTYSTAMRPRPPPDQYQDPRYAHYEQQYHEYYQDARYEQVDPRMDPRYQDPRYARPDPRYQDPQYQHMDPRYQRPPERHVTHNNGAPRYQQATGQRPPERQQQRAHYSQNEEQRYHQGPPPPSKD
jgi:serine/threonine protein kinase